MRDNKTIISEISDVLSAKDSATKLSFRDVLSLPAKQRPGAVKRFQEALAEVLNGQEEIPIFDRLPDPFWKQVKDRADIFADDGDSELIVEIDTTRADQVAKKMSSRFTYSELMGKAVTYVAVLYPGTTQMNVDECKKFFKMGEVLLKKINKTNVFIGYIINPSGNDFIFCLNKTVSIDFNNASETDRYEDYLRDHNVETEGSIDSYKQPLNKLLNNPDAYEQILRYRDKNDKDGFITYVSNHFYEGKISDNNKSYWNKFWGYLYTF